MIKEQIVDYFTRGIASLTVVGSVLIVMFILGLVFKFNGWNQKRNQGFEHPQNKPPQQTAIGEFWRYVGKNFLFYGFIIALIATLGSLFFSEFAGYNPCKLCWFQRIFMYPLVLLYGVAILRKDRWMGVYGFLMSIIGAAIAGYHYLAQLGIAETSCEVVGYSSACSEFFTLTFGYVTIPMMALVAFLLIAISSWIGLRKV
jgi:disulfide bond formation protein DsbB